MKEQMKNPTGKNVTVGPMPKGVELRGASDRVKEKAVVEEPYLVELEPHKDPRHWMGC